MNPTAIRMLYARDAYAFIQAPSATSDEDQVQL